MSDSTKRKAVLLRLDADVADQIKPRAEAVGASQNEWINRALRWALSQPVHESKRVERT